MLTAYVFYAHFIANPVRYVLPEGWYYLVDDGAEGPFDTEVEAQAAADAHNVACPHEPQCVGLVGLTSPRPTP